MVETARLASVLWVKPYEISNRSSSAIFISSASSYFPIFTFIFHSRRWPIHGPQGPPWQTHETDSETGKECVNHLDGSEMADRPVIHRDRDEYIRKRCECRRCPGHLDSSEGEVYFPTQRAMYTSSWKSPGPYFRRFVFRPSSTNPNFS